jgi:putative endonuclease
MAYYVYVFRSAKDGQYYIGSTSDVAARLAFHNAGLQRSTKSRIPFSVVLTEEYATKGEALRREKQIKSWKGGQAFSILFTLTVLQFYISPLSALSS